MWRASPGFRRLKVVGSPWERWTSFAPEWPVGITFWALELTQRISPNVLAQGASRCALIFGITGLTHNPPDLTRAPISLTGATARPKRRAHEIQDIDVHYLNRIFRRAGALR